ncbi:transglycosylase SLT domain-containing protein [Methylobacterium oryzisoli]|uniref:transglycosylase SLT domain-containing protein n=1 Tax=Methylobacterium oryzisoli TaxID=3385502 RepID=UPI003892B84A
MRQRLLLAVLAIAAPLPALSQSPARDSIDALIEEQARASGVPASFVHRVVKRESGYNPRAVGRGGAMGLMQIKHATARGLGYGGSAAGLLDAKVNLTYGVAYLAGAYKTARGNEAQAYSYYARGYYYAAKRAGIRTDVAELEPPAPLPPTPVNPIGQFFGKVFGGGRAPATVVTASADPSVAALSNAVQTQMPASQAPASQAPASQAPSSPQPAAQAASPAPQTAPAAAAAAPLPPQRPAPPSTALAYAGGSAVAGLPFPTYGLQGGAVPARAVPTAASAAPAVAPIAIPAAAAPAAATIVASAAPVAAAAEDASVSVPLPPRRPAEFRRLAVKKPASALPMTAAAAPVQPSANP